MNNGGEGCRSVWHLSKEGVIVLVLVGVGILVIAPLSTSTR
jgi:hypothetical protein